MGYPTHHISEKQLISSMKKTGFSEFRYEFTENGYLIFSGKKIKNI
jgi:hypothetical protein